MGEQKVFTEPSNLAVITLKSIIFDAHPILLVVHDADEDWQFLDGNIVEVERAAVVALSEIVGRDSSVLECADLPIGWVAYRSNPQEAWTRRPHNRE